MYTVNLTSTAFYVLSKVVVVVVVVAAVKSYDRHDADELENECLRTAEQ